MITLSDETRTTCLEHIAAIHIKIAIEMLGGEQAFIEASAKEISEAINLASGTMKAWVDQARDASRSSFKKIFKEQGLL